MKDWKLPWEGGCRCGELRFRVTRPPMLSGVCHCTGCQAMTGSAFSTTLTLPPEGFEIASGTPVRGGLGTGAAHHMHCPRCLSWVFTRADGFDWFVNLRATMLDEHRWFTPFVELWTAEKLPWAETGAPHSYPRAPPMEEWETLMRGFASYSATP